MHFRGKQELDAFTNCIDVVGILKLATHFERMAIGQRGVVAVAGPFNVIMGCFKYLMDEKSRPLFFRERTNWPIE